LPITALWLGCNRPRRWRIKHCLCCSRHSK